MALDACFLTFLTKQLNDTLSGSRVDRIFMPSRDESVFVMRGASKHKLLINASTNSPRISLTEAEPENPPVPPTFCMLLRKHFTGARLKRVYMPTLERCVVLDFECKNEFYETVDKSIAVELMGRSANMILIDGTGHIIDAVRRIDLSSGSGRCVLPSARYEPAPAQEGKTPLDAVTDLASVFSNPEITLERAIMQNICGISPVVARELALTASGQPDMRIKQLGKSDRDRLTVAVDKIKADMQSGVCSPCIVRMKSDGKPVEFSFMSISQYGEGCECVGCDTPSAAVEGFFSAAAKKLRMDQKTRELSQLITRTSARVARTMEVRKKELAESENASHYRVCGELINANLYRMKSGDTQLVAQNYYDGLTEIKIPLRANLSPSGNAQAYFKKYTKARNSAEILKRLIESDRTELEYLESVFLALCDCESTADVAQIRAELVKVGYLKSRPSDRRAPKPSAPLRYEYGGFTIYIGRNNTQNDEVTVRLSRKNDIWLHTKSVHSAHTLISCGGRVPPDNVIEYAAGLCAGHSKAKNDLKVEVDYCPVQNVKKPTGAKPGMVVYDVYNTVIVNPIKETQEEKDK